MSEKSPRILVPKYHVTGCERIEKKRLSGEAHVVAIEDMHLTQARYCVKENREERRARLAPFEDAGLTFQEVFPALGSRMFYRT